MSEYYFWSCIILLSLITLITRGFFQTIGSKLKFSPAFRKLIQYAPTGALIAIVIPEIFYEKDLISNTYQFTFHPTHLYACIATIICYYLTKSMVWSITVGMLVLNLLQYTLFSHGG